VAIAPARTTWWSKARAGGHRATFAPDREPGAESLYPFSSGSGSAQADIPLIAAFGLGPPSVVEGDAHGSGWPPQ